MITCLKEIRNFLVMQAVIATFLLCLTSGIYVLAGGLELLVSCISGDSKIHATTHSGYWIAISNAKSFEGFKFESSQTGPGGLLEHRRRQVQAFNKWPGSAVTELLPQETCASKKTLPVDENPNNENPQHRVSNLTLMIKTSPLISTHHNIYIYRDNPPSPNK